MSKGNRSVDSDDNLHAFKQHVHSNDDDEYSDGSNDDLDDDLSKRISAKTRKKTEESTSQSDVRIHFQEGKTEIEKVFCPKCLRSYYPWTIKRHVLNCTADLNPFKLCKYCSKKISIKNIDRHSEMCKKSVREEKVKVEIDDELRRLASECMDIPEEDVVFSDKEDDDIDFILYSDPKSTGASNWEESSGRSRDGNYSGSFVSPGNQQRRGYSKFDPSKVTCPSCGLDVSHADMRKHAVTCGGSDIFFPCRYCFKKVSGMNFKRHLQTCKEYFSQSRSSLSSSKDLSFSRNDAKVIDITPDGDAVETRLTIGSSKGGQMCVECETKFSDRKQLNEHLIVYHKYQWRTAFPSKTAFNEWFCRKKFDQTMSRIEQISNDGCTQEGYRCTSSVKGFSRCGCRLTVRFSESEAVARYVDIHSHPVVHYKRRLSQGCREMLIKMLQDGMSNEEVIVEARKKVDPRSIDYSLISRKNLNSLRYHHIKRYWHFDEIDLDKLGNAALEEEQAKSRSLTEERLRKILDDSDNDQNAFISSMEPQDEDSEDDTRNEFQPRSANVKSMVLEEDRRSRKRVMEEIVEDVCHDLNKVSRTDDHKKSDSYPDVDYDDLALGSSKEDVVYPVASRTYAIVEESGVQVQNEDGEEFIEVEVEEVEDSCNDDESSEAVVYLDNSQITYTPSAVSSQNTADLAVPEARKKHISNKERTVRFSEPHVQDREMNSGKNEVSVDRKWRGEFLDEINTELRDETTDLKDAAIQSEPVDDRMRRNTIENIVKTILPCLQRAMYNPNVSEKRLRIIRSQLTDMIVDLQPHGVLDDDDNFLPAVSIARKRGRPKGSGREKSKRAGVNN